MVDFDTPTLIEDLQKKIPEEELYYEDDDHTNYGFEKETHVTLVACLDNDVTVEDLKPYLKKLSEYKVVLTDISKFDNEKFDVLKCSAKSFKLDETNKEICDNFKTHSEYKVYKPHVTIAYMKKGMADKYLKNDISPLVVLKPKNFTYSWWEGDDNKKEKFSL